MFEQHIDRDYIIRLAWETGNLEYKVRDYQLPVYNALHKAIDNNETLS